jgi:chemotaxis protein CheC
MAVRTLTTQTDVFQHAAVEASSALSKWLGRPTTLSINKVSVLPLQKAVGMLGSADAPLVACAMQITGAFTGLLVLACDDASGLSLADMLLDRPPGNSQEWGELEQSAVIETANIIGCAYLNTVSVPDHPHLGKPAAAAAPLMPSPPWFVRDYAAAVMQSILMAQASVSETIFLTHSDFLIEGSPTTCSLVFVPAADD